MVDFALSIMILVVGGLLILSMAAMIIMKPVNYFLAIDFQAKFGSLFEGIKISSG